MPAAQVSPEGDWGLGSHTKEAHAPVVTCQAPAAQVATVRPAPAQSS
jgi:hypothetical protein